MNGLTTLNIELTSRCNKRCPMCGRRKIERDYPELCDWGDMPFSMVEKIAPQVPEGIVVQFHNNGDPLLYPALRYALQKFPDNIRQFDTNAKLLWDRASDIINNVEVVTVSVIENDTRLEKRLQRENVEQFLELRGDRKPRLVFRCLGDVDTKEWEQYGEMIVTRVLHKPEGSFGYEKPVTKPEIGICLEMLNHLVIDRYGNVSPCVRFDPDGVHRIGNIKDGTLEEIWNSPKRMEWVQMHIEGRRNEVPLCAKCDYWGIPRGE